MPGSNFAPFEEVKVPDLMNFSQGTCTRYMYNIKYCMKLYSLNQEIQQTPKVYMSLKDFYCSVTMLRELGLKRPLEKQKHVINRRP